uniref:Uncharacterized protein n=1 Tax=Trypanosoma congolense (strain IL3000) TaxID=1068625 RepID=G0UQL6_TRYCI|nr:hypothetical protein, unlikely [Trypanosoma congolense IL3000]
MWGNCLIFLSTCATQKKITLFIFFFFERKKNIFITSSRHRCDALEEGSEESREAVEPYSHHHMPAEEAQHINLQKVSSCDRHKKKQTTTTTMDNSGHKKVNRRK